MQFSRRRILRSLVVISFLGTTPAVYSLAATPEIPTVSPAEAGFDADALAKIPARMNKFIDDKILSGSVTIVVRQGKVAQVTATGYADTAAGRAMTPETMFAIASMTKPITATAMMILQDEGKLSVDDDVARYIPQFKDAKLSDGSSPPRPIKLRDLLTHNAGTGQPPKGNPDRSLADTCELLAKEPLEFAPGTKWKYGVGLTVCGRVIEVVSGQPFDEFVRKRITEPLDMVDTTFHPNKEQLQRIALIYKPSADKTGLEPDESKKPVAGDAPGQPRRTPNPSGGLYSTARDMARFYQMVLNGGELFGTRIISEAAAKQMTTIQTGDIVTGFTPGNGWGLGWCVVREPQGVTAMLSPGTYGHGGAYGTQGWVDPQRKMIAVLMIQRVGLPNSDESNVRKVFQQLAVDALK